LSSIHEARYPHDLPRAYPPVPIRGCVRSHPADFVVDERAAHGVDDGDHLLLKIEKVDRTTAQVAAALAAAFDVPALDVSFAGMKDRRAVTRQWFSVRTPSDGARLRAGDGWTVLERCRRPGKLRRGELQSNAFSIRVRGLVGDRNALAGRLAMLGRVGVPNYFGAQRFGHCAGNIVRAHAWLTARRPRPPVSAFQRGLHLSTARALLFNAVLAARVDADNWRAPLCGDVLEDGVPTGPLWGRGRSASRSDAAALESHALAAYSDWLSPLEHVGLKQARRPLVAMPTDLDWSLDGDVLTLQFVLAPGQYATAVLRELGDWREGAAEERT
jgi:tRNA pseudouridine13 synthase